MLHAACWLAGWFSGDSPAVTTYLLACLLLRYCLQYIDVSIEATVIVDTASLALSSVRSISCWRPLLINQSIVAPLYFFEKENHLDHQDQSALHFDR